METLGTLFDGSIKNTKFAYRRLWKVRGAIDMAFKMKKITGYTLEVFIGHCMYCGLFIRDLMCTFLTAYKFICKYYTVKADLWTSVRQELEAFRGLIFLVSADWGLAWITEVHAADASP